MIKFRVSTQHLKLDEHKINMLKLLLAIANELHNRVLKIYLSWWEKNKSVMPKENVITEIKSDVYYKLLTLDQATSVIDDVDHSMKSYYQCNKISSNVGNINVPRIRDNLHFCPVTIKKPKVTYNNNKKYFYIPFSQNFLYLRYNNFNIENDYIFSLLNLCRSNWAPFIKFPINEFLNKFYILNYKLICDKYGDYFKVCYLIKKDVEVNFYRNNKCMAIDLGVTNLATCITTDNFAFIIDGKVLKSRLRLYNKLLSKFSKESKSLEPTEEMRKISIQRENYVNDYINKAVRMVINQAKSNDIRTIIIGWNERFKTFGIGYGSRKFQVRKVNQLFMQTPLARFRDKILNESFDEGIKLCIINESYTSISSFYDNDPLWEGEYSGKRINRGLYVTKKNKLVNADLNGALNIYRKYVISYHIKNNKLDELMNSNVPIPKRIYVK